MCWVNVARRKIPNARSHTKYANQYLAALCATHPPCHFLRTLQLILHILSRLSKSSSFLPLVSHRGGSVLDGNELLPSGKTFRGGAGKNPQDENESVRMVYPWRPGSGSGTRPASAEMQLLLAAQRDRERSKRAASKDPRPKSSHDGLFSKGVMDPPPPRPLSGKLVQNFRKAVRQTSLSKGPGGRPVKKFLKPVTPRTGREGRAKKQAPRSTG